MFEGDTRGSWDRDRLAQVLSNLIGNAIQHGAAAVVTVSVRGEHEGLRLTTHNHGECIPMDLLPHIFDPFRSATKRRSHGLGLGLLHHEADRRRARRTDRRKVDRRCRDDDGCRAAARVRGEGGRVMVAQSVLTVDDEDDLRDLLCEALAHAGFQAFGARHGREALTLLDGPGPRPSLILLDLLMPVLDGVGFLRELAARGLAIPVIITTSAPNLAPPGFRVLKKPTNLDVILDTVTSTLAA